MLKANVRVFCFGKFCLMTNRVNFLDRLKIISFHIPVLADNQLNELLELPTILLFFPSHFLVTCFLSFFFFLKKKIVNDVPGAEIIS